MSLALQKALTMRNIQSGYRTSGIQRLNFDAMVDKMNASENFQSKEACQQEDIPSPTSQEAYDIQIEKILKKGKSHVPNHFTHYYVSMEDDSLHPSNEDTLAKPSRSQPICQFLRLTNVL